MAGQPASEAVAVKAALRSKCRRMVSGGQSGETVPSGKAVNGMVGQRSTSTPFNVAWAISPAKVISATASAMHVGGRLRACSMSASV